MPLLVVFLLVFLLLMALFIGLATSLFGLLIMLFVAGFVGWLADLIVPGQLPYGWLGAIIAGLLGAWLGTALFGTVGPSLRRHSLRVGATRRHHSRRRGQRADESHGAFALLRRERQRGGLTRLARVSAVCCILGSCR